jgi:chromosome segregation ATPase
MRFNIHLWDGRYFPSVPTYQGGEVVTLDEVQELERQLVEASAADFENGYRELMDRHEQTKRELEARQQEVAQLTGQLAEAQQRAQEYQTAAEEYEKLYSSVLAERDRALAALRELQEVAASAIDAHDAMNAGAGGRDSPSLARLRETLGQKAEGAGE